VCSTTIQRTLAPPSGCQQRHQVVLNSATKWFSTAPPRGAPQRHHADA